MSFRAVFIVFSALLIVAIIGGGIFLWFETRGVRDLKMQLTVPEEIQAGVPFALNVAISNESANILKDAELTIELPEGVIFAGSAPDKNFFSKNIGNLGSGSLTEESFDLLALSGERTVKEVQATITYLPQSLNSKFEKSATVVFAVSGEGIAVDVSLPEKVFGGETFEAKISYTNLSETDFNDVRLKVAYPPSFSFRSASLPPDIGNGMWELGDVKKGSKGEITVKGSLIGPDNAFFELITTLEARFLGRSYTVAEKSAAIVIAPSALSLEATLDKDENYFAKPGDDLVYTLRFTNNTDIGLKNVIVQAKLTGAMFDLQSLQTSAALRTADNTLLWNAANTSALLLLPPGASGEVRFRIRVRDYPIARLSDKNFTLKVDGQIESPTVPSSVAADRTIGVSFHEVKVGGQVKVDARGLFRDASSGILNKGPWPPQSGKATNFTIHWLLTNYGTDIENVEVKAFLGGNVRFTGVAKSTAGSAPTYTEATQEVVWKVGNVIAGKGILGSPAEAIFQVEAIPSINQVGAGMILVQPISVSAHDLFTGEDLAASDSEVKTTSLDDPTVQQGEGNVVP